ncbi:acyltransferase [Saccharomonospora piscinae]|uniref:Acyltransferase n=1 Tax=Saccharomonospora piscinae TaxID=687388 RepID=A0A1V9A475_SACPI|nr:acyltransferase [Saccharomonospora piscinae]OQO91927.1 acyltransferase [Saccharomonospora piscinae]
MTVASRPPSSRRISWDVVRVVAILFVVLGHVTGLASDIPGIEPYPVQVRLSFGTVTLLVLSGYFIGPTLRRGNAGRWFRARLARLLPAYLVAVVLVYTVTRFAVVRFNGGTHQGGLWGLLVAEPIMPEDRGPGVLPAWHVPDLNDLVLHVLLLHEWNPDGWHRIDGSYWTLPVQVAAFACAALLWRAKLHRRVGAPVMLWAAMGLAAVAPLLGELISTLPGATGMNRAYLFAAGVAIWLWQQRRLPTVQLAGLLGAALVLQFFRSHAPALPVVLAFAVMLVAMCAAARGPDWDVPVLRSLRRPVSWLAGISYCLYLVHQQLGYVLARALSEAGVSPWWLRLSLVLGAVVLLAWLLTVCVERPAYRALTRRPAVASPTEPGGARSVPVGGAT